MDRPPLDFIGIGAQKAGTTWLWTMLRRHPQIWLPPRKELHYFDRSTDYPSPSFLAEPRLLTRLLSRAPHNIDFRRKCWRRLGLAAERRDWAAFRWGLRYYFGTINDRWYCSLFAEGEGRVRGEITPSYSILDAEDVGRVRALLPGLKIILLLRNPIERAWSQIRFDWTRGATGDIDDLDRVQAFIDAPIQALRGDYVRTLDLWEAAFSKERVFTGFYDDITGRPAELLADVLRFLSADPELGAKAADLARRVHVSKEAEIPLEIRRTLARKYHPELVRLSARLGGPVERWRREAEELL